MVSSLGSAQGVPPGQLSPLARTLSEGLRLAHSQRGTRIRGSLKVSPAGVGGRLEVRLLVKRASLAGFARRVRVGRLVRASLPAGTVSFRVAVNAKARRALRAHRRLALTVKISLTNTQGSIATSTRSVVLHA